jgi:hypothetical protein
VIKIELAAAGPMLIAGEADDSITSALIRALFKHKRRR